MSEGQNLFFLLSLNASWSVFNMPKHCWWVRSFIVSSPTLQCSAMRQSHMKRLQKACGQNRQLSPEVHYSTDTLGLDSHTACGLSTETCQPEHNNTNTTQHYSHRLELLTFYFIFHGLSPPQRQKRLPLLSFRKRRCHSLASWPKEVQTKLHLTQIAVSVFLLLPPQSDGQATAWCYTEKPVKN